ncbi:MAG TPA: hypothetical protein VM008_09960 [Phycisphaerae bacterium]|nr:hypothetical protein [Phycisphaerae bacterium]
MLSHQLADHPFNASPPRSGPAWWMLLLIGLLAAGVYANSLKNGFAFDDVAIVENNTHVLDLDWVGIWTDNYWPKANGINPDSLYRPLTLWTYLANQAITPGIAGAFHATNVLLHALVTVLASILAWRLIGNRWAAVLTGVLFAVHPLHTEAVANTVGRAEILAALWSVLAMLVYLPQRPLIEERTPEPRRYWHGIVVAACFLAAMLSKESPATLIPGIVLIDCWRAARRTDRSFRVLIRWFASQALRYYLPLVAAFAIYLPLRIHASGLMTDIRLTHPIVNPLVDATIAERIVTPFMLFAKYVSLTFWPAHLSADYSMPSFPPTGNVLQPLAALGILSCLLGLIVSIKAWRKLPQIALVLCLLMASYGLVANVIRIGTIFGERLFYWPSAFVLMLAAWALVSIFQQLRQAQLRAVAGLTGLLLVTAIGLMCRKTWIRNTDWESNITLAVATGRDNPMSGKACSWAGSALVTTRRPEFEEFGLMLIKRAIELAPDYASARWELAKYYGFHNDIGDSITALSEVARIDGGSRLTCAAVEALLKQLRETDPKTYMPVLESYQHDHAEDEAAYFALALGYHAQKKYDLAEQNAIKAVELGRKRNRAGVLDRFDEAGAEWAQIRFDKGDLAGGVDTMRHYAFNMCNSTDAHCRFAELLISLDPAKFPEALKEAELNLAIAHKIDPTNERVRELRGRISVIAASETGLASAASLKSLMAQLRGGQGGMP